MSALPVTVDESFYTPSKVEYMLRQLPYMLDGGRQRFGDGGPSRKHFTPSGWREEQMSKRADIEAAFDRLPEFTRRCVYLVCIGDKTYRDVAGILDCSGTTVMHHKRDGIRLMAWYLGWRDPALGYGERNPKVRQTRIQPGIST